MQLNEICESICSLETNGRRVWSRASYRKYSTHCAGILCIPASGKRISMFRDATIAAKASQTLCKFASYLTSRAANQLLASPMLILVPHIWRLL